MRATEGSVKVYEGHIVDAYGDPLADVAVALYLDVSSEADRYSDPLLGATTTGAEGTFVLSAPYEGQTVEEAATNNGYVNFLVMAVGPSGSLLVNEYFSKVYREGQWVSSEAPAPEGTLTMAASSEGVLRISRAKGKQLASSFFTGPARACGGSSWITVDSYSRWADVGELHMTSGMSGWFKYARTDTADSDIGVAVSVSQFGGYEQSGTTHVGNSDTSVVTWNRGPDWSKQVRTQFEILKQKLVSCGQVLSWRHKTSRHAGGAQAGDDMSQFDHRCDEWPYSQWAAPHAAGTEFERISNHAVTWNLGLELAGINVSTQSGYGVEVRAHWDFSANKTICGNNDYVSASTRVWAGV